MINWEVRIRNKNWWIAIIPAILLLVQAVAKLFGFELQLEGIGAKLIDIVNAAFVVLTLLGVINDPTTAGMNDSKLAMTYERPKE